MPNLVALGLNPVIITEFERFFLIKGKTETQ
jgi:hypothetical protein